MKPSIPKGTRDFGPVEMARRNYIFNTIRSVFELYGFQPIETPAMENLSTLTGKYGEEGDQLIFKILNSRIHDAKDKEALKKEFELSLDSSRNSEIITEKALRYDLTVPFARYVVQHRDEITFPFKRYQIQPVWRADRPQKGRYREFYQCDADVVGSNSLLNEVELVQIIDMVFSQLGIEVTIKINNRKILAGVAEVVGEPDKMVDIAIAVDKLEKIGMANVFLELKGKGFSDSSINKIQQFFEVTYKNDPTGTLKSLRKNLANSQIGLKGIEDLEFIISYLDTIKINTSFDIDISLARGLNYYTGAIFEVKANNGVEMGSISGGGRYDNLTGVFGMEGVSGVGISFGADRIYDVLQQLNRFPDTATSSTKVLFINFGANEELFCLPLVKALRNAGISAEIFPENAKMDKQMKYANSKKVPFVILAGENEMKENNVSVKDMVSGNQSKVKVSDLLNFLLEKIQNK